MGNIIFQLAVCGKCQTITFQGVWAPAARETPDFKAFSSAAKSNTIPVPSWA